ncbi:MAG: hypothetical protein M1814_001432 [Vezdaea aestivalis]|nr:MAG: hypothetical protein M1814_001432 [Vezdaea aestivalis]
MEFRREKRALSTNFLAGASSSGRAQHHGSLHATSQSFCWSVNASSSVLRTDGVTSALEETRVQTPWITALRDRQASESIRKEQATLKPDHVASESPAPKTMSQSRFSFILPLAQDPRLSDTYLNASGRIRLGTLFMDLDALSGVVAYRHTGPNVMTVTAACDRIQLRKMLDEICDLHLSGQVTFSTGRSSMEISLQVAKVVGNNEPVRDEDILLTCAFTMVSLDPETKKPVNISPLKLETPEEERLFKLGETNYHAKKVLAKTSLLKKTPNDLESDLIHEMWLKQLEYNDPHSKTTKPANATYTAATILKQAQIMQPQYRNRHHFMIFGGFLLKQTVELAFCCCASFAHTKPTFVSLDPSTFLNPVPVGSVLYLSATVAYAEPHLTKDGTDSGYTRVQIRVDSEVRNVEHEQTKPTGQFNYTFLVDKKVDVIPQTYQEYMNWVEARRRVKRVAASLEETHHDHFENRIGTKQFIE